MLAHPNFNYISIETYKQEILPTFMTYDCVYRTFSFNGVNVEVVANIQS